MAKLKLLLYITATLITISALVLFFVFKISPIALGLHEPINVSSGGLAMKGYDPVAYFTQGRAVKGDTTKGIRQYNAIWYFASDTNKLAFKTFPAKYIPQFGGYCATAVSEGLTADADPEAWHIEDGKLYLFFDQSPKNDFVAKLDQNIIADAETHWNKQWQ